MSGSLLDLDLVRLAETTFAIAPELDPAVDRAAYAHFGRLTPAELADLRTQGIEHVIRPCVDALLAVHLSAAA